MKKKEEKEKLVKVTVSLYLKPAEKKLVERYAKELTLRSSEYGVGHLFTREAVLRFCVRDVLAAMIQQRSIDKVVRQLWSLAGLPF